MIGEIIFLELSGNIFNFNEKNKTEAVFFSLMIKLNV